MPRKPRSTASSKRIREHLSNTRLALRDLKAGESMRKVLRQGFDTDVIRGLLNKGIYVGNMHPKTLDGLQSFVNGWIDSRAKLEIEMDERAMVLARKKKISKINAYWELVGRNRRFFERRLEDKEALEQLLFVMNHQREKKSKSGRIDTVAPTKVIRGFGSQFYEKGYLTNSFIRLVEAVAEIPMVHVPKKIAEAYYGLPTAEETVLMGRILTRHYKKRPMWGCGMQCNVINAVLKSWKWENYHVRTKNFIGYPHSVVLTRVPERGKKLWLVADPFVNGRTFLRQHERLRSTDMVAQVGLNLGRFIRHLESQGKWREGKCLRDHVKNYFEYEGEK